MLETPGPDEDDLPGQMRTGQYEDDWDSQDKKEYKDKDSHNQEYTAKVEQGVHRQPESGVHSQPESGVEQGVHRQPESGVEQGVQEVKNRQPDKINVHHFIIVVLICLVS